MKRIIVPVDFSSFSERALQAAIIIADNTGASLSLVHVITTNWNWDLLSQEERQKHTEILSQAQEADEKLAQMADSYTQKGITIEKMVLYGYPYEQITQLAGKQTADLIIIGAYGKEKQDKYYIGSTIQKVLRTAPCPVLAVKDRVEADQFKKFVFASDYSELAISAFQKVKQVARVFGATLHLVYINTPAKFVSTPEAQSLMNSFSTEMENIPFHTHIYDFATIEDGLESFTNGLEGCCLALATNERKLSGLYLIGVTETMVYRLTTPVLSVKMH